MDKASNMSQAKLPYLVAALGVGLMAVTEVYTYIRAMMLRAMFQAGGHYGSGFQGGRQFNGGFGFGGTSIVTVIALVVAIAGVVWLGLALRKSPKSS
jgi:uncharacterized membrane protein